MSIKGALRYDRRHVVFSNFAHAISGFGLALLLQNYYKGHVFMSTTWAWLFIIVGLAEHVLAFTDRSRK